MNTTPPSHLDKLQRLIREVPLARDLYHGLKCRQSLSPDNIIFFRRDGETAQAEGASHNYHHRFELAIVVEPPGPVRIDQMTSMLQPGDCTLIFPNQFHHYLNPAEEQSEWLFLTFDIQSPEAIQGLRDRPRTLDARGLELLEEIIGEFVRPGGGVPDSLSIAFHLSRLLLHLLACPELPEDRRDIHAGSTVRDVILEKINRYVREHLNQSVSISDIAAELGYSVSHLRAVFRDRLGVSLGRYMRESRLAEAAQLLQTSELNVSLIGERCGFESLYAFSRAFRKAYGAPPRAYRQLVQEGRPTPATRRRRLAAAAAV